MDTRVPGAIEPDEVLKDLKKANAGWDKLVFWGVMFSSVAVGLVLAALTWIAVQLILVVVVAVGELGAFCGAIGVFVIAVIAGYSRVVSTGGTI